MTAMIVKLPWQPALGAPANLFYPFRPAEAFDLPKS
jgi:hypothetical protein